MCIIPNWFQLPLSYAVSRSVFAIDVRFNDKLDRGFFAFYNFPSKRALYVIGKRTHNYYASKPSFIGRFPDGYGVDEKEYRQKKYDDMLQYDKDEPIKLTKQQLENRINIKILSKYLKKNPKASLKECADLFGVTTHTITRWKKGDVEEVIGIPNNYKNKLTIKGINEEKVVDEEELMKLEKEKLNESGYYNEEEQTNQDTNQLE